MKRALPLVLLASLALTTGCSSRPQITLSSSSAPRSESPTAEATQQQPRVLLDDTRTLDEAAGSYASVEGARCESPESVDLGSSGSGAVRCEDDTYILSLEHDLQSDSQKRLVGEQLLKSSTDKGDVVVGSRFVLLLRGEARGPVVVREIGGVYVKAPS